MSAIRLAILLGLVSLACGPSGDKGGNGAVAKAEAAPAPKESAEQAKNDPVVAAADMGRIAGDTTARVWLIMVSDFECPYCKMWHDSTSAQVHREFVDTKKIRLAYVNYPLEQHRNAMPAAEAAMCSAAQGKFWPVHDGIFETQNEWKLQADASAFFQSIATKAGVELTAYKQCVSSHKTAALIKGDYTRSAAARVNSTPTFIVGNEMLSGAQPIGEMRRAINAALAANAAQATAAQQKP